MISKLSNIISPEEINRLNSPSFMRMKDGRKLAYYQYGAKDGIPTFFCHGTGSHIHAMLFHKAAKKFGYKLIVPDRPGIGLSEFKSQITILDEARDIESLADHLDLKQFGLIGISGGGPTLFACAYSFPARLKFVVALACAAPLYTDPSALRKLGLIDQVYAKLGKWLPLCIFQIPFAWLRYLYKHPQSWPKMVSSSMCQADIEISQNKTFQYMLLRDGQELFKQGLKGAAFDAQFAYHHWGFDLRDIDIKCHIHIRQGSADRWVPPAFSKYLQNILPNATLDMIPGQGHFYHMVYAEETFKMLEAGTSR